MNILKFINHKKTNKDMERTVDNDHNIKENENCDVNPILKGKVCFANGTKLEAQFADRKMAVKELLITDSLKNILEGTPSVINWMIIKEEKEKAIQKYDNGKCVRFIEPEDFDFRNHSYRYELHIEHFEKIYSPLFPEESDWYHLVLIWFDSAPINLSLQEYINTITIQYAFFDICKKMTEDEKEYWI